MGNVVNLNKFRKAQAKATRVKQADTNRRLHGRTNAERARDELQKKQLDKGVEGARLEPNREPELDKGVEGPRPEPNREPEFEEEPPSSS